MLIIYSANPDLTTPQPYQNPTTLTLRQLKSDPNITRSRRRAAVGACGLGRGRGNGRTPKNQTKRKSSISTPFVTITIGMGVGSGINIYDVRPDCALIPFATFNRFLVIQG
eukprot:1394954-Amorphochlora_amoeboformis.AAC.1